MIDTPPDVTGMMRELYRQRTPGERLAMAFSLFNTAKALAAAGIRADSPGISESELRLRVFDRFYGREVAANDRVAIIERIRHGR